LSELATRRAYDRLVVRIASPTFVGRAAELAALDEALDSAAQGHTTTVLIGGDAGVGKSRLLNTWNERARERGARIAAGSCLDLGESGPAYVAIVQALRELLGPLKPEAVDALVRSDRSTLALIIPELVVDTAAFGEGQRSSPIAQTRLFDRLVRVLDRASSDAPLVLELEDIHWADPSTRAFLVYLVANARAARLLIIATFRAEEAGREHPLTPVLRQLGRHPSAQSIGLPPFDTDELREQLHGILGEAPTNRLLAAIRARSEGNALFAEELIASGDPGTELPSSIGAALLSRTAGFSRSAQVALRAASVAGRTASYDVLRSASHLANDEFDVALREVLDANILQPEQSGERYRFRHALLQEAIYSDTLPGERRRLHASVAEALESDAEDGTANPELASELAYHWFEAKESERALKASLAAGDTAVGQTAYAEALYHYERVLDLWDTAPLGRADLRQADILERAGRSAFLAGEPQKAVEFRRRALDELDVADDAILRVRVLDGIARALHWTVREAEAIDYEFRLGAIELDGLPVEDQLTVLDARVRALRWKGDRAAASLAAVEAQRLADGIDAPALKGLAHVRMAWNRLTARDFDTAIDEARRAGEFASIAGDAETEVEALSVVYEAYGESGQFEMAVTAARAAREYADHVDLSDWEGPSAWFGEAAALFQLGRLAESRGIVEAALVDPPPNRAILIMFHMLAAEVEIVCGSYVDAATHLEAARVPEATPEEESERGYLATVRAELASSEGRLDDVRAIVDNTGARLAPLASVSDAGESVWRLVEIGLDAEAERAEVGRAAGDAQAIESAGAVASTFLSYVDAVRRYRDAAGVLGSGSHNGDEALIEGHLARIDGRDDPSLWAAAVHMFPSRSPRGLTARYRQAEAMLATRAPREEIRAVMAEAHAAAVAIGARPLAGRFESLARRARLDLRQAPSSVADEEVELAADEAPAPGTVALRGRGLSDREIEVLTLVAAGFSNHDIGSRLFISDKTASVHVSHILGKLEATSRTEAATIGVRLGLPDVERDDGPS
jgi:DNA-binding CsgD family transcriptional regulator/tetratricopeptide (TPR) repeat protein